ncbi:MAG: sulfatase-like hydrolase/transferase, partial [Acidobacteriota bacterium]
MIESLQPPAILRRVGRSLAIGLAAGSAVAMLVGCGDRASDPRQWNVLVVTLDTTRADRLGPYGYPDAGTPNYDAIAAGGFVFAQASTSVPMTLPAHSTIFTGTYPPVHGVRENSLFRLPDERTTLAEVLRDAGWDTGGAVGAIPVTRQFGIAQGFNVFDDHVTIAAEDFRGRRIDDASSLFFDERSAARVNDAILPWLRQERDQPFFAWIHYWDAHQPLHPPPPYDTLYARDLYQGEIAYVDENFGIVVRTLEELGEWENTLVVIVGDHGEGIGEHQEYTHSMVAYEGTVRVPLIVRVPGFEGGRTIDRRVGTVDIVPTVLDFLDLEEPSEVQGESLVPLLEDPALDTDERNARTAYYAETLAPRLGFGWGELRVLYRGDEKYIHGPRPELFDLANDRKETSDLVATRPDLAEERRRELVSLLDDMASDVSLAAVQEVDLETRQKLEALGYISGSAESPESIREELREDGDPPQDRVLDNSLMSAAKSHLGAGRWGLAFEAADQLLTLDPDNAYYRGLKAQALIGLGKPAEAADVIEELEGVRPGDDAIIFNVARLLFSDGAEERAFQLVRETLEGGESAAGRYLLAEMLDAQGQETEALAEFEASIAQQPTYALALQALAVRRARRGERDEARTHFEALIRAHPLQPRYRYNYGVFLLEEDDVDAAIQQLERATELAPTYWTAQLTLLALHRQVGQLDRADALYREVRTRADAATVDRADRLMAESK